MQEVFEKVIEKLEERTSFLSDCTKYENKDAEQQNKSYSTMMMYEVSDLVDDLIEIVKQTAEEFGTDINVGSNGWIPVSERLPKRYEYVYVTCHSLCDERPNWVADTIYVDTWGIPIVDLGNAEVIAWKKKILPEPYQPKGE